MILAPSVSTDCLIHVLDDGVLTHGVACFFTIVCLERHLILI